MPKEIMNIKELAEYLDISEGTIYKKVSNHEIPFTKLGTLLRFSKWSIDQWIDQNTVKPPDALFNEFAKLYSRYHFKKWLESQGINSNHLSEAELLKLVKNAISDLENNAE